MKLKFEIELDEETIKSFEQLGKSEISQKSEELANKIILMNTLLFTEDLNFIKYVALSWEKKSVLYDSAAALNPRYSPNQSEVIMQEAKCIGLLAAFIEQQHHLNELREKENKYQSGLNKLSNLF